MRLKTNQSFQTARAASDPAMTNGSQNKFMSMKSISGSEDCLDRSNNDQVSNASILKSWLAGGYFTFQLANVFN